VSVEPGVSGLSLHRGGYLAGVKLAPVATSAGTARSFCDAFLTEIACDDEAVRGAARLVVSELVANVVRHAHTPAEVYLSVRDGRIRIEVTDSSWDSLRWGDSLLERRGLPIVDELSDQWGVVEFAGAKTVWAELAVPPTPEPQSPQA
jgi:hypothetical protein